jgi:hypothetical protein
MAIYRHPVDYSTGQPGDHAPTDCAELRRIADARYADRLSADESAGGYHAGWGICAGTVAPSFVRVGLPFATPAQLEVSDAIERREDLQARSIHDEEVNAMRERVASSWVKRALVGELPAKEYGR